MFKSLDEVIAMLILLEDDEAARRVLFESSIQQLPEDQRITYEEFIQQQKE